MESDFTQNHAQVLRYLIIALGGGTDPDDEDDAQARVWPVHADSEPEEPDRCVTVYATEGRDDGQSPHDGSLWEHFGWQVRVRSRTAPEGHAKANEIRNLLASVSGTWTTVTVPDETGTGVTDYRVETVSPGQVIPFGYEPGTKRCLHSVNGLATIDPNP